MPRDFGNMYGVEQLKRACNVFSALLAKQACLKRVGGPVGLRQPKATVTRDGWSKGKKLLMKRFFQFLFSGLHIFSLKKYNIAPPMTRKGPFRLMTVNTAPDRAYRLICRLIHYLGKDYNIMHVANAQSMFQCKNHPTTAANVGGIN